MKIHCAMSKTHLEEILERDINDDEWVNFVRRNSSRMGDELRLIAARLFDELSK